MKKILVIVIYLTALNFLMAENIIIRINDPGQDIVQWTRTENLDHTYLPHENSLDIYLNEEMLSEPVFERVEYEIITTDSMINRNLDGYRTYQDVLNELNAIAADPDYQDFTYLFSLGPSQGHLYYDEGNSNYQDFQHEVWCLKLSDNPEVNEDEPNIFLAATIHARETISLEVDMHILYHLIENYGIDTDITEWINSMQIWMIPLINPDGHKLSVEELHTMHRKNLRDNDGDNQPDYSHIDGVDLNRNFDFFWDGPYSSSYSSSTTYRGPYPWSEPEAVYLRDLKQQYKFWGGITYHSYGQIVLYPLGHSPTANSADHLVMGELAEEMASTIPLIQGGGYYNSAQASNGYLASGSLGDWGYGVERIFSFTVELGTTYYPPAYQIDQICEDNLQAALIMIDRISHSTVTGNVTNGTEPLVVEVYVEGIDNAPGVTAVEPVRSDASFGRYYRLLQPGSYTITFHHAELGDQVFENVIVSSDEVTTLNVDYSVDYVSDIEISIDNELVHLEWPLEPDMGYTVYSSSNPYSGYQIDLEGSYLDVNIWEKTVTAEKQFFKVVKSAL